MTIKVDGLEKLVALADKFEKMGGNLDAATASLADLAFGATKDTFSASTDPYGTPWKKLTPRYAKWKKNNLRGDKPIGERYGDMWNKFRDGGKSVGRLSFTLEFDVDYAGFFSASRPLLPTKQLPKRWIMEFEEAFESFILEMTL